MNKNDFERIYMLYDGNYDRRREGPEVTWLEYALTLEVLELTKRIEALEALHLSTQERIKGE